MAAGNRGRQRADLKSRGFTLIVSMRRSGIHAEPETVLTGMPRPGDIRQVRATDSVWFRKHDDLSSLCRSQSRLSASDPWRAPQLRSARIRNGRTGGATYGG